jgi:transcriptional regulator with XRE-family HTH domain
MTLAMASKHDDPAIQGRLRDLLRSVISQTGSEKAAGEALGFSQSMISQMQSSKKAISQKAALAIAQWANLSLDVLYGVGSRSGESTSAPGTSTLTVRAPRDVELALLEAYRRGAGTAEDVLAVLDAIKGSESKLPHEREAAILTMARFLSTASRLRRDGQVVTLDALAWAAMSAFDASAEGEAQLAALGGEVPRQPVRTPARGVSAAVPHAPDPDEQSGQHPKFAPTTPRTGTR